MDQILDIATKNNIIVIEDNAHGLFGKYKGKNLGTLGHMATQSFHETKNVSCGEGGALVINYTSYVERAEVIIEKGTDIYKFFYELTEKGLSTTKRKYVFVKCFTPNMGRPKSQISHISQTSLLEGPKTCDIDRLQLRQK